jgi:hypothetical protein
LENKDNFVVKPFGNPSPLPLHIGKIINGIEILP